MSLPCLVDVVSVVVVVAVAAAIDVASPAAGDDHPRGAADGAADVAAAEEAGIRMAAALDEDEAVVVHAVHAASAVDSFGDHGIGSDRRRAAVTVAVVRAVQMHPAAYMLVGLAAQGDGVVARHGTLVAAAIDGAYIAVQQDDVGQDVEMTLVVAAVDDIHMVAGVGAHDIHEHRGAACDGDTVAAAVDGVDMSCRRETVGRAVDVDVYKGVGLHRLVVGVAVLANGIVVVAVAATIDGVDLRTAGDADVSPHIVQRGDAVGGLVV